MNQGIAFARTIRALEADDFRGSKFGLFVAAILLGAWTWWLFAARVPQYETTSNVRMESGRAIAYFASVNEIRAGQTAIVSIGSQTLPARVQNVADGRAELVFTSGPPSDSGSGSATAEVETSRVSPAAIALRTLGRVRQ